MNPIKVSNLRLKEFAHFRKYGQHVSHRIQGANEGVGCDFLGERTNRKLTICKRFKFMDVLLNYKLLKESKHDKFRFEIRCTIL